MNAMGQLRARQAGELGAEAFHIPPKVGQGRGQESDGALCWSSRLLGVGVPQGTPGPKCWGCPHSGKLRLRLPK